MFERQLQAKPWSDKNKILASAVEETAENEKRR